MPAKKKKAGKIDTFGLPQTVCDTRIVAVAKQLVPPSACENRRPGNSKYCKHIVIAVLANILRGMKPAGAGELAGLGCETVSDWRKKYPDFDRAVGQAHSMIEGDLVDMAMAHARTDPATCLKLLAMHFPDRWAPTEKRDVNLSGNVGVVPLHIIPDVERARAIADGIAVDDIETP